MEARKHCVCLTLEAPAEKEDVVFGGKRPRGNSRWPSSAERAEMAAAAYRTPNVPERQCLVDFYGDANGFNWHHRILFWCVEGSIWVGARSRVQNCSCPSASSPSPLRAGLGLPDGRLVDAAELDLLLAELPFVLVLDTYDREAIAARMRKNRTREATVEDDRGALCAQSL